MRGHRALDVQRARSTVGRALPFPGRATGALRDLLPMNADLAPWMLQGSAIIEHCLAELTRWNRAEADALRRELAAGGRLRIVLDEPTKGLQRLRLRLIAADGVNRWVFCWYAGSAPAVAWR